MSKKSRVITKNLNRVDSRNNVVMGSASDELKKLSTILVSIIGILCIFYIITIVITRNSSGLKYSVSDDVSQISYTDILASDILNKSGSYYVLVRDNNDYYLEVYDLYLSSYTSSEESLTVYYVDLQDALNQKYKASESDFSNSNLKISGTTLLKIVDGTVNASYDDNESITNHLKSLVESK